MRFSSAIVLVFVAALASSASANPVAAPDKADVDYCPNFCTSDAVCSGCIYKKCVSNVSFPKCDYMAHLRDSSVSSV